VRVGGRQGVSALLTAVFNDTKTVPSFLTEILQEPDLDIVTSVA